ncbi:MAG TPA: Gfo/Idh/MocA family oxidoreductase [Verrucomicrobiota bacterium]|nr:gfo/Idh/MocA family oxidoreductase [Verrucomicrobiales bacterium]HRI11396.1 Gfo/Idh/MocA family oxidoreductase [Verrucomicrobiota bacterium]
MTYLAPLRLGIIGCGNVLSAYRAAADKLKARGWAEITAACGRESQRTRVLQELGPVRFTVQPEEICADPDIDIVIILTSMSEHAALADQALAAGKHVLVEKPLATSLDDAEKVLATAQRSKGLLVCAPFTVLSPTFQILSRRIRAGDIGQPCSARARYGWAGPSWSEWFYRPGGGCLFDLGVYCLTSLTGLLGPARRVTAFTGVAVPEREINGRRIRVEAEDNAQVLLDFGGGCFGAVTSGFTMQQYRNPALEVYGTTGTIQMLGDDWDPDGYELWQNEVGCWQCFKETDPDWHWTDGLNHLVECIRTRKRPSVTPEHARHVLEIMLKAQQSGREGKAFDLTTTFTVPEFAEAALQEAAHLQHDRTREQRNE